MTEPSEKSLYKLKHLFNLLGLRIIPGYFLEQNKNLFQQWQYNACVQTALITGWSLRKLLDNPGANNSNPFQDSVFEIEVNEGMFTEEHGGEYNHGYVFAHEVVRDELLMHSEQAYSFFIDVARISNPTVFQAGIGVSDLPVRHSNNYQMHAVHKHNMNNMLLDNNEYFTKKSGLEICVDINRILLKLGYDLEKFNWNM